MVMGLVGVMAGSIVLLVGFVRPADGSRAMEFLAPTVGYALVGVAWWWWTPAATTGPIGARAMRRSSRALAAAAAVTSLGYLASAYSDLRILTGPNQGMYSVNSFRLVTACYLSEGVGFLLAAVAFWIAPRLSEREVQPLDDPDAAVIAPSPGCGTLPGGHLQERDTTPLV